VETASPGANDMLYAAIEATGFYPTVMAAAARRLLAGRAALGFVTMTDLMFDADSGVRTQAQLVAVSATKLLFWGAVEQPGEEGQPPLLRTYDRSVPLARVEDVRVECDILAPATFAESAADQDIGDVPTAVRVIVVLTPLHSIQLEPIFCDETDCEGGHGTFGDVQQEVIVVADTLAASAPARMRELLTFSETLAEAVGRG
jgi:hypothetical protein